MKYLEEERLWQTEVGCMIVMQELENISLLPKNAQMYGLNGILGGRTEFFIQSSYYLATDLFNLFDGVALSPRGLVFFQVKSDAWPKTELLNDFKRKYGNIIMALNVRKKDNRIQVFKREYPHEGNVRASL